MRHDCQQPMEIMGTNQPGRVLFKDLNGIPTPVSVACLIKMVACRHDLRRTYGL